VHKKYASVISQRQNKNSKTNIRIRKLLSAKFKWEKYVVVRVKKRRVRKNWERKCKRFYENIKQA
jgi:hypothetical protein